jgi:hypothetical protein
MLQSVFGCLRGFCLFIDKVLWLMPTVKVRLAGICSSLESIYIDAYKVRARDCTLFHPF